MAEKYCQVAIKVVSQKGHCAAAHKVGDEWVTSGLTPPGICLTAFSGLLPYIWALMYGGVIPWEADADKTTVSCTDAANPVVFELTRLHKSA